MIALTTYLLCGATSPQSCEEPAAPAPSHTGAEVAGIALVAAAAITTVVLIDVHHNHHTVKGCVFAGPNGIQVQTQGDPIKTYTLSGITAAAKVGDLVKIHGDKIKKTKDSTGDETFRVESLSKDYGPCQVKPGIPSASAERPPALH